MIAIQIFLIIAGSAGLIWAMVVWMLRASRREKEIMDRRHEEWRANGANPEEKPNFYSGTGCGAGG